MILHRHRKIRKEKGMSSNKKNNDLDEYTIPINYKLDASLFGIEIKWKRFGESVLMGIAVFFQQYLFILQSFGFLGF